MPESIMHTFTCRPPIIAMLPGSALTPAWGAATPARQQAAVGPGQALSIRQQDRLSDIAVKALHQIAAARADIARRNAGNTHQALQIARTDNQPQTGIRGIQQHIARLAATPPPQRKQEQYSQLASELSILISQS